MNWNIFDEENKINILGKSIVCLFKGHKYDPNEFGWYSKVYHRFISFDLTQCKRCGKVILKDDVRI